MLARVFTLRFSSLVHGFDDAELVAFLRDREVAGIHEHFFEREGQAYLAMVVTYRPTRPEAEDPAPKRAAERSGPA